jgi:hypothetical protein
MQSYAASSNSLAINKKSFNSSKPLLHQKVYDWSTVTGLFP